MSGMLGQHDAATSCSAFLSGGSRRVKHPQSVTGYDRRDIARRQRLTKPVVVVPIARIEGHLKVVDHHHRCRAVAKDGFQFFGER